MCPTQLDIYYKWWKDPVNHHLRKVDAAKLENYYSCTYIYKYMDQIINS